MSRRWEPPQADLDVESVDPLQLLAFQFSGAADLRLPLLGHLGEEVNEVPQPPENPSQPQVDLAFASLALLVLGHETRPPAVPLPV